MWGASWLLPPVYRSSTLILVEQPTMPQDYVTPNVNDDLQDRMQEHYAADFKSYPIAPTSSIN